MLWREIPILYATPGRRQERLDQVIPGRCRVLRRSGAGCDLQQLRTAALAQKQQAPCARADPGRDTPSGALQNAECPCRVDWRRAWLLMPNGQWYRPIDLTFRRRSGQFARFRNGLASAVESPYGRRSGRSCTSEEKRTTGTGRNLAHMKCG